MDLKIIGTCQEKEVVKQPGGAGDGAGLVGEIGKDPNLLIAFLHWSLKDNV